MENLSASAISSAFKNALRNDLVSEEDSALIFYDLGFLSERVNYLKRCFPDGTLHGLAVKACPLADIMNLTRDLGCGVEAASSGEVKFALHLGFKPSMIVYDSPVKTRAEIKFAINEGVHLNLDNFTELERVKKEIELVEAALNPDEIRNSENNWRNGQIIKSASTIGIRINPQIGEGTISESSVAGEYSKFGVPLKYKRKELITAFIENDFLTGLHLHVGSQGCSLDMLAEGVGRLYDLMLEINNLTLKGKGFAQITTFDIGGGLPVSYFRDKSPVLMEDYVEALKLRAPLLFTSNQKPAANNQQPSTRLITEFGRWTYTNSGWAISRVEYVKHDPEVNTAMIHVGADLFVRECLNPRDWQHEYTVLDKHGNIKTGNSAKPWNLAGPLCFAGDILAKGVSLPDVNEGDYIVVHDSGGYTFSMWSRYNSRYAPGILGYYNDGESFVRLKEREGIEDIIRFWT